MKCETVRVKPWGKGQGEFVEINATDYDPEKFELYGSTKAGEFEPLPKADNKEKISTPKKPGRPKK